MPRLLHSPERSAHRTGHCPPPRAWSLAWALPLVLAAGCSLEELDVAGKLCTPERGCGEGMVCASGTCVPPGTLVPPTQLIPQASTWRYLDTGVDPGAAWVQPEFDDAAWKTGQGPLGYDNDLVRTEVGFGPSASNKYITTWFRHAFEVSRPEAFTTLTAKVLRDDGAVVYLNGQELGRTQMPPGPITPTTRASAHASDLDEVTYHPLTGSPSQLRPGRNVLAVEVHQDHPDTSDLVFDVELLAE